MLRQTPQNCQSSYTSHLKPEELHLKYTVFKDLESHLLWPANVLKKVVKVSTVLIFRFESQIFIQALSPESFHHPVLLAYQFPSAQYCFKIITEHPKKAVRWSWAVLGR